MGKVLLDNIAGIARETIKLLILIEKKNQGRSPGLHKPGDLNQFAASIVKDATEEKIQPAPETPGKNPAAVALGRLGGLKGGKARAVKLSSEERKKIAKKAAKVHWERIKENQLPQK